LNKETKIQRKKMKDQSVFETKQWGSKKKNYFAYKYMIISHKKKGRQKNLKKIQKKKNQILSLTHKKILNLFCYFLATSYHTKKCTPITSIFMAKKWLNSASFMPIITITGSFPSKPMTTFHCPATPHKTKKRTHIRLLTNT